MAEPTSALPFNNLPGGQQSGTGDFQQILRLNGVDVDMHACVTPSLVSQFSQGFVGYPRGYVAGILQAAMMQGTLGETNKKFADLRHQQLAIILYEAFSHYDLLKKILAWFVANQLADQAASLIGRMVGGLFTNYALKFNRLGWKVNLALQVPNLILASYGSAIMKVDAGDRELARIIGAIITGYGNFEVCIPIDAMKQQLEKMESGNDEKTAKLFDYLMQLKSFVEQLGLM